MAARSGLLWLMSLALGGFPAAAPAAPSLRLHRMSADMAGPVRAALAGAARRLERTGCAGLLHDFSDEAGQPLADRLAPFETDGPGYLRLVVFSSGQHKRVCHGGRTLAFTSPGSRVVYVCPAFAATQRQDPALAEFVVIHEALHTLGLGENPPSSAEITERVADRCRR